jgi:hypothetical protein
MYFKYLGQMENLKNKDFDLFKEVAIHYPLIVKRESGETVLRTPMSMTENALVMDSEMTEGTEFWFTYHRILILRKKLFMKQNKSKKKK